MYQLNEIKIKEDNKMNKNKIKQSWKEVTINEFKELNKISVNEKLNDIEKNIKTLAILSDYDEEYLYNLNPSQFVTIMNEILWIQNAPETDDIVYSFNYNGVKIEFDEDISNLTTKQYMNIVELNKNQKEPLDNLHLILASLATITTDNNKLNVPEFILNNFSIIDAISISNFFFAQSLILTYASSEMQKMMIMKENPMSQEEMDKKELLLTNLEYSQLLMQYQILQD